ncbi:MULTISPECIES: DUF5994 family protein [unclassified Nonomuraea]|uniref:DUF5994 family protein n=1 Tax=unclassified Nonomuraea TaxID=2593643 RepID=UPI0033EC202A
MPPALLTAHDPLSAAAAVVPRVDSRTRLDLDPVLDRHRRSHDVTDGTWWPYSRDAADELPSLIAAVDQRRGRTTLRVGVHAEAWEHIPRRLPARGRRIEVRLFHHAAQDLIVLCFAGGEHLALRIVPPDAARGR